MSLSFRLDGKVALVTGASRGLGAGIADALKEAGATVAGTSREQGSAEQVAERLDSVPFVMDVSDVASVRAAVVDTNLKGTFFAAQAAARHMVAGGEGGRIINVASQAGVVGIEERSAYGASKGGTVVLTKEVAAAAVYLASPAAALVTGHTLMVDGGWTAW